MDTFKWFMLFLAFFYCLKSCKAEACEISMYQSKAYPDKTVIECYDLDSKKSHVLLVPDKELESRDKEIEEWIRHIRSAKK